MVACCGTTVDACSPGCGSVTKVSYQPVRQVVVVFQKCHTNNLLQKCQTRIHFYVEPAADDEHPPPRGPQESGPVLASPFPEESGRGAEPHLVLTLNPLGPIETPRIRTGLNLPLFSFKPNS
jgi:hypothetical protein